MAGGGPLVTELYPLAPASPAVMAGVGPPSTPLFAQAEGVEADHCRHEEAALPESRCHRQLV